MRVADRPFPPIVLDDVPQISHWPVRPVIAIEGGTPLARWDDGVSFWDDGIATWDGDPDATGWLDATCAWFGLELEQGTPDDAMLVPATRLSVQLDNRDGRWSGLDADGTQSQFAPGKMIQLWAHRTDVDLDRRFGEGTFGSETFGVDRVDADWWLFSGRIARWDQRADDSIEVEAFDSFSDLAQPIGSYTPGVAGQRPSARLQAIIDLLAAEDTIPNRWQTGTVTLSAQVTDQSPLEEMQVIATSDAGLLFVDADGTLLYLDRTWRAGRTDQGAIPSASGNVCTADVVVWEPLISTSDDRLADYVNLENLGGVRSVAGTLPGFVYAEVEQQWRTQEEGDAIAALYLNDRTPRRMAVEELTLYLLDPHQPDIWRSVDWRRLDRLRFVQDRKTTGGSTLRIDIDVLVASIVHEITPEGGWTMTVGCSRAISTTAPIFYDTGHLYDTGEVYGF